MLCPLNETATQNIYVQFPAYRNLDWQERLPTEAFYLRKHPMDFTAYQQGFELVQRELHFGNSYLLNLTYPTPIEISWKGKRNAQRRDLLISLQTQIPEFVTSFNQVIEFVPVDETEKAQARERYKQYRQQGWQLLTEQIS